MIASFLHVNNKIILFRVHSFRDTKIRFCYRFLKDLTIMRIFISNALLYPTTKQRIQKLNRHRNIGHIVPRDTMSYWVKRFTRVRVIMMESSARCNWNTEQRTIHSLHTLLYHTTSIYHTQNTTHSI